MSEEELRTILNYVLFQRGYREAGWGGFYTHLPSGRACAIPDLSCMVHCVLDEIKKADEERDESVNTANSAPNEKNDRPSDYEKWFYENSLNRG